MADIIIQSTGTVIPSLDDWFPITVPMLQPWPQRHAVSIQRLTIGEYAMNHGHFMHAIPVMQFVVSIQGVLNRPLAGSWDALAEDGWSLWDPADASPLWEAVAPSGHVLVSEDEAIAEFVPDSYGDITSARRYTTVLTNEGSQFTASVWQAEMGWAVAAFRLMPAPQSGPVISFLTASGMVRLNVEGHVFAAYVDNVKVGTIPRPAGTDYVYVVGICLANTEARFVVRYGGKINTITRPYVAEPGVYTLELAFGGNSSPEMLVYALAHGYEFQSELAPNVTRFHRVLDKIAGFLAC